MEGIIYLNNTSGNHSASEEPVVEDEPKIEPKDEPKEEIASPSYSTPKIPEPIESESDLSETFENYISDYENAVKEEERKVINPIYVDEIASKVARVYESLRRIVDWKEEHLIRRAAIERMLRRRFVTQIYGISIVPNIDPKEVAEPFVHELVRSGHFKNGSIPKEKISIVEEVLDRYINILNDPRVNGENLKGHSKKEVKSKLKRKLNFYTWILELASCEIEFVLNPPLRHYALMDLMTESLYERTKVVPENAIFDDDVYLQTYIAVRRALFNLDSAMIHFDVVRERYPEFFSNGSNVDAGKVLKMWDEVEDAMSHPKGSRFYDIAEKYDAAYLLIGDAMDKFRERSGDFRESVSNIHNVLSEIGSAYNTRLATLKKRLYRLAIFSTLSIFVAGGFSLVIFEIPVARLVRGYFSPWAIVADMAIPTALMFFLVTIIKPPSKENLNVVKEEVEKIIMKSDELDVYEVDTIVKKRKILNFLFAIIYLTGGFGSLYFIYWVFKLADVPWTSLYIDTINVAMVVFAAMVIKQRSSELSIVHRETLVDFFLEPFSIPLAKIGSWVSDKWKEYNIVSILFTALVDYPFSTFVATLEGWRNYMKQKRSGLH